MLGRLGVAAEALEQRRVQALADIFGERNGFGVAENLDGLAAWCRRPGGSRCSGRGAVRDRFACWSRGLRRDSWSVRGLLSCSSLRFAPSKILVEFLAEFQPRPQEARFYRRHGDSQNLRGLFGGNSFHVAQEKSDAENRIEFADHAVENFIEFGLGEFLLGGRAPVLDFAEDGIVAVGRSAARRGTPGWGAACAVSSGLR